MYMKTHPPQTDEIYVHLLAEFNPLVIGRTQKSGDIIAYDGNGLLLFYIQASGYTGLMWLTG